MTYHHNNKDPNLNNIHHAMEYRDGVPHLRVNVGSDIITINGNINVDNITVDNLANDPVPISSNKTQNSSGNPLYVNIGNTGTVSLSATTLSALETINVNATQTGTWTVGLDSTSLTALENINATVSGTVELGTTTLNALENINATVSGTVALDSNTLQSLENINATVSGSVSVSNFPASQAVTGTFWQATQPVSIATMPTTPVTGTFWQAIQPVSGTVTVQDGGGSITVDGTVSVNQPVAVTDNNGSLTVDGTVSLSQTTLDALETITVNQGTNPWVTNATITGGSVTVLPDLTIGDFYGEPYAIGIEPVVQLDGRYGIDARETQTYISGGGAVISESSCFKLSCTSTVGSYAVFRSRRFNTYKPGQSFAARGYLKFDDPLAGTSQRWGVQNQESAFYIGYNGTRFGILHVYGGRVPLYRLTLNSYTGNQTVTVTLNGVSHTADIAVGETTAQAAQRIALALSTSFSSSWLCVQRSNTVEFLYTGTLGPLGGTFSVTSSGNLSAAITTLQAGVTQTNEWIYPGDTDSSSGIVFQTLPAWFDPTTFNKYQLKYSWAGINAFVLDPTTGRYFRFFGHYHVGDGITQPQIANPAFKVASLCYNTGGSTPVSMYVGDMSMFLEGQTNRNKYNRSASVTQTSLTQTDCHHLLSIQNTLIFNNTINALELLLQDLTATTQCNDPAEIYLFLDAPLSTGLHDFQSTAGFAATVSKVAGLIDLATNEPLISFVVGNTGSSVQYALDRYRTVLSPGSTISIAVRSTATIQKAAASLVWYVD
jgi:hypothetical protein